MSITASTQLLNAGLKTWIFKSADVPMWVANCNEQLANLKMSPACSTCTTPTISDEDYLKSCENGKTEAQNSYKVQKAQDLVQNFALLIVGLPLFIVHMRWFRKEYKNSKQEDKAEEKK
jgi:hypothetical protein